MLKKTLPTIILLYGLFIVFFLVYMKMYFQAKKESANHTKVYNTYCGNYKEGEVKIGTHNLLVYIADDKCKRDLGLSGMKLLKDDEGMMFIFDIIGQYPFWMKDMNFSIDILWVNENSTIVGVEKNLSPKTYPKAFGDKYKALYVLEVQAGYFDKTKIKVGDKINFYIK